MYDKIRVFSGCFRIDQWLKMVGKSERRFYTNNRRTKRQEKASRRFGEYRNNAIQDGVKITEIPHEKFANTAQAPM